ncbi:hypothetical protein ACWGI8_16110 [Streptomyces sp. NPDC054841]
MTDNTYGRAARTGAGALLGMLALLVSMLVLPAGAAQAAPALPGGKANWVVSVGGLDLPSKTSFHNWVRLGYYVFKTDGTVETNYWNWSQQDRPVRETAIPDANCGGDVPVCDIRTVQGFGGSPTGGFRGTFDLVGDRLTVTWTKNTAGTVLPKALTEYWNVETGLADGGVARIVSSTYYGAYTADKAPNVTIPEDGTEGDFSDYSATFGIGYGSNAELGSATRASMDQLRTDPRYNAQRYRGAFVVAKDVTWKDGTKASIVGREGAGGDWTFSGTDGQNPSDPWRGCLGGACMGYLQPGTGCASLDLDRVRYIGEVGGGRRNTEEYWCQGLAQGADCYLHNSHPRPMLQVIDDSGQFQGWVGAEAFSHVDTSTGRPDDKYGQDYWGVFDMVSISALQPRVDIPPVVQHSKFTLNYGNSVATGALKWEAESVQFVGSNHVVSGCRRAYFTATGADGSTRTGSSSGLCPGMTPPEDKDTRSFQGKLDFQGVADGPTSVRVEYQVDTGGGVYTPKVTVTCTRYGGCR